MDIKAFLEQLEQLIDKIDKITELIENSTGTGMNEMPGLISEIEKALPDWFYFIKNTEIGDPQYIMNILEDISVGMETEDGVLLADALFFGLREMMLEYTNIIKEALDEE